MSFILFIKKILTLMYNCYSAFMDKNYGHINRQNNSAMNYYFSQNELLYYQVVDLFDACASSEQSRT